MRIWYERAHWLPAVDTHLSGHPSSGQISFVNCISILPMIIVQQLARQNMAYSQVVDQFSYEVQVKNVHIEGSPWSHAPQRRRSYKQSEEVLITFHVLHITASWYTHALLESNRSYASSWVGLDHELSVIFPNTKDEARSQNKHLQERDKLKNAQI